MQNNELEEFDEVNEVEEDGDDSRLSFLELAPIISKQVRGISVHKVRDVLNALTVVMMEHLAYDGNSINIRNFGILSTKKQKHHCVNVKTGKGTTIPIAFTKFKTSTSYKKLVRQNNP
jgi:nucleoid DNA-binding protein